MPRRDWAVLVRDQKGTAASTLTWRSLCASSVKLGAKSTLCPFFWSETIKLRLANQVNRIRHWKIVEGSWEQSPDIKAHWHVDPPYQNPAGRVYRYNGVNCRELAKWCKRRRGFVQVCENDGASWLRFEPLSIVHNPPSARLHGRGDLRDRELTPFRFTIKQSSRRTPVRQAWSDNPRSRWLVGAYRM